MWALVSFTSPHHHDLIASQRPQLLILWRLGSTYKPRRAWTSRLILVPFHCLWVFHCQPWRVSQVCSIKVSRYLSWRVEKHLWFASYLVLLTRFSHSSHFSDFLKISVSLCLSALLFSPHSLASFACSWFIIASLAFLARTWPFDQLWSTDNWFGFSIFPNSNSQER